MGLLKQSDQNTPAQPQTPVLRGDGDKADLQFIHHQPTAGHGKEVLP
jgi:hypothetical protein